MERGWRGEGMAWRGAGMREGLAWRGAGMREGLAWNKTIFIKKSVISGIPS